MTKEQYYSQFVGKEGFSNGLLNMPITGTLDQVATLREGICLGYFKGGTIINLDTVKLNDKFLDSDFKSE